MARLNKNSKKSSSTYSSSQSKTQPQGFMEKIQSDLENKQSILSLVLGALIVLVVGILLFNYFNRPKGDLGPSEQVSQGQTADVKKENLPGKYTVKEGDTLFLIAQNYYGDGYMYNKLAEVNNLSDPSTIEVGQVLEIPKPDQTGANPSPSAATTVTLNADNTAKSTPESSPPESEETGQGGAINQTIWGEKISSDTYTIVEGDWLSKIAGRAYGDIYAYDKIAKANNISNPDLIEPGVTLKIPR